ncbi:ABC transporter permease [Baekduia sp. Peel2402]|uniref:ABC transporter permease n=1 Tax=Baekduia sp. Peel2402 TaxID=3458296 RepID=UPI00403E54B1
MTATWDPLPPLPAPTRLRLRSVGVLYWVRLRRRWLQELLAIAGIAVGVGLLYAGSVANSSLSAAARHLNQGIIGTSQIQVVARSGSGFSDQLTKTVLATPGVRSAAPILQAQASLVGSTSRRSMMVYASDPELLRKLNGALVQGFNAAELAGEEFLAVTTAVGDQLHLRTGDLAQVQIAGRAHVAGIVVLGRRDIGVLADQSMALAPLPYLQRLGGLDHRLSRLLVEADPDQVGAVQKRLAAVTGGRVDVRHSDYEPKLFDKTAWPTAAATLVSSTISSIVGFLFAACAMLVTITARRVLALDLRRSGYSNRQITGILLVDALALGITAVALGLVLGEALSRHGFSADVGFMEGAFPIGDERVVTWSSVAIAAGGGLFAAIAGALGPLVPTLTARGDRPSSHAASRRVREAAGLVLLAAVVVITIWVPGAVIFGVIALTVAVVLLLPSVLDATVSGLRWISHRSPRTLMGVELALPQLTAPVWRVRSLAIATIGALAVLGGAAVQGARSNLQSGLDRAATVEYDHTADVWVSSYAPGDLFGAASFPLSAARGQLAAVQGVRDVRIYRGGFLDVGGNRAWVRAPEPDSPGPVPVRQVLDGSAGKATARFRAGGWVTLSRAIANALDVDVGDRFVLPSPVPTTFRVGAITTNLGWPGGAVILNSDDYARAWGTTDVSAYQLAMAPGVTPEAGAAAARQALGRRSPLRVETATQRDAREMAASRGGLARLRQISSLMLVAAVLAMGAAMAGLLWQQRVGVARQKLDGHRTVVMWRALAVESGVLIGVGCLFGALASLLGQVLSSRGLQWISGFPIEPRAQLGISAAIFGLVTGIAVLAVAVPGYLVARVDPSLRATD